MILNAEHEWMNDRAICSRRSEMHEQIMKAQFLLCWSSLSCKWISWTWRPSNVNTGGNHKCSRTCVTCVYRSWVLRYIPSATARKAGTYPVLPCHIHWQVVLILWTRVHSWSARCGCSNVVCQPRLRRLSMAFSETGVIETHPWYVIASWR